MTYPLLRSRELPQAVQVQVSWYTPTSPMIRSGTEAVSRIAAVPQKGQTSPGLTAAPADRAASSAATRFSKPSILSGASVIRRHALHSLSTASTSLSTANG